MYLIFLLSFLQEPNDTREGDWFLNFYPVNEWPHVSIIDPRTGGRLLSVSNITNDNILETSKNFDCLTVCAQYKYLKSLIN